MGWGGGQDESPDPYSIPDTFTNFLLFGTLRLKTMGPPALAGEGAGHRLSSPTPPPM